MLLLILSLRIVELTPLLTDILMRLKPAVHILPSAPGLGVFPQSRQQITELTYFSVHAVPALRHVESMPEVSMGTVFVCGLREETLLQGELRGGGGRASRMD
jgi:hypothetical protein